MSFKIGTPVLANGYKGMVTEVHFDEARWGMIDVQLDSGEITVPESSVEELPSWEKVCECGATVTRWHGESYPICPGCETEYNAGGQRLRDDWRHLPEWRNDDY